MPAAVRAAKLQRLDSAQTRTDSASAADRVLVFDHDLAEHRAIGFHALHHQVRRRGTADAHLDVVIARVDHDHVTAAVAAGQVVTTRIGYDIKAVFTLHKGVRVVARHAHQGVVASSAIQGVVAALPVQVVVS